MFQTGGRKQYGCFAEREAGLALSLEQPENKTWEGRLWVMEHLSQVLEWIRDYPVDKDPNKSPANQPLAFSCDLKFSSLFPFGQQQKKSIEYISSDR